MRHIVMDDEDSGHGVHVNKECGPKVEAYEVSFMHSRPFKDKIEHHASK